MGENHEPVFGYGPVHVCVFVRHVQCRRLILRSSHAERYTEPYGKPPFDERPLPPHFPLMVIACPASAPSWDGSTDWHHHLHPLTAVPPWGVRLVRRPHCGGRPYLIGF